MENKKTREKRPNRKKTQKKIRKKKKFIRKTGAETV